MDGSTFQIAQISRFLLGILHAGSIIQLAHAADAGLEILHRIGRVRELGTQVGIHIAIAGSRHHGSAAHIFHNLVIVLLGRNLLEFLALVLLDGINLYLTRVEVEINHTLVYEEQTNLAITADVFHDGVAGTHDKTILIIVRPCHAVLILRNDFRRTWSFKHWLLVGKRILGVVAIDVNHHIVAIRLVGNVWGEGTDLSILGESGRKSITSAFAHQEVLVDVAIIEIDGIFTVQLAIHKGLLLLYVAILVIRDVSIGKLTVGIIILVEFQETSLALQGTINIIGLELLSHGWVRWIESIAIIAGESLVGNHLPILVVVDGVHTVLRNSRSWRWQQ